MCNTTAGRRPPSDRHKKVVQGILQRLFDEGQIYKAKQAGYYSVRQEQFLTDKERGPDGEFGPEWGAGRISRGGELLLQAQPAQRMAASISRQSKRRGHPRFSPDRIAQCRGENQRRPLHFSAEIAALLGNRVSVRSRFCHLRLVRRAGELHQLRRLRSESLNSQLSTLNFPRHWPALHIIGKDILVPAHGIYWLIMLHALGFPDDEMPQLLVHGWWNLGGAKMSKSAGNIIDPYVLADKYGPEALRYYLMSDIGDRAGRRFCRGTPDQTLQCRPRQFARQFAQPHAEHGCSDIGMEN